MIKDRKTMITQSSGEGLRHQTGIGSEKSSQCLKGKAIVGRRQIGVSLLLFTF